MAGSLQKSPFSNLPAQGVGRWYLTNSAASPDQAEVMIYDVIGAYGITADQFVSDLKAITAKTINVRINSPGGSVFDGTAIYNALRDHPAEIVTHVDGLAASAASFIAMSGDKVCMANNAYLMVHDASSCVMGGAGDLRIQAGLLDKINQNIADMYAKKTGKPASYWLGKMADETWYNAADAKQDCLIDSITPATDAPAAPATNRAFNFGVYNFSKIPEQVRKTWGITSSTSRLPGEIARSGNNVRCDYQQYLKDKAAGLVPAAALTKPNSKAPAASKPITDFGSDGPSAQFQLPNEKAQAAKEWDEGTRHNSWKDRSTYIICRAREIAGHIL